MQEGYELRISESQLLSHFELGRTAWSGADFAPLGFAARKACPFVRLSEFLTTSVPAPKLLPAPNTCHRHCLQPTRAY